MARSSESNSLRRSPRRSRSRAATPDLQTAIYREFLLTNFDDKRKRYTEASLKQFYHDLGFPEPTVGPKRPGTKRRPTKVTIARRLQDLKAKQSSLRSDPRILANCRQQCKAFGLKVDNKDTLKDLQNRLKDYEAIVDRYIDILDIQFQVSNEILEQKPEDEAFCTKRLQILIHEWEHSKKRCGWEDKLVFATKAHVKLPANKKKFLRWGTPQKPQDGDYEAEAVMHNVKGDGNCMVRAMAAGIFGPGDENWKWKRTKDDIRTMVRDGIDATRTSNLPFYNERHQQYAQMMTNTAEDPETLEMQVERDDTWCGVDYATLFADCYDVAVFLWEDVPNDRSRRTCQLANIRCKWDQESLENQKQVHVYTTGPHWLALIPSPLTPRFTGHYQWAEHVRALSTNPQLPNPPNIPVGILADYYVADQNGLNHRILPNFKYQDTPTR